MEAKFLPLVKIAGSNLTDHPEIKRQATKDSINAKEFKLIAENLAAYGDVHDAVPNLLQEIGNIPLISVYTINLNHPNNPTGHNFLLIYTNDDKILLCYRSVDYSVW